MIKYSDLVEYTKEHHISWEIDLFDILRDFFQNYCSPTPPNSSIQQEIIFPSEEFVEPEDGEYTIEDVLNLFNT